MRSIVVNRDCENSYFNHEIGGSIGKQIVRYTNVRVREQSNRCGVLTTNTIVKHLILYFFQICLRNCFKPFIKFFVLHKKILTKLLDAEDRYSLDVDIKLLFEQFQYFPEWNLLTPAVQVPPRVPHTHTK